MSDHFITRFLFISVLLCVTSVSVSGQAPDSLWTKYYGGAGYESANSMVQLSDGGLAIVGEFNGYNEAGLRYKGEIWLVRTDNQGDTLWTRTYGEGENVEGRSVKQTADGGFIISGAIPSGSFNLYDAWLIRTDENGDTLWTKKYGDRFGEDFAIDVIETSDGGFVFTGYAGAAGSGRSQDGWLVKTDEMGDTLWTKNYYSGDVNNHGVSVVETSDGGYFIAGLTRDRGKQRDLWMIRTDENGDSLWTKTYDQNLSYDEDEQGQDIIQMPDGGFLVLANAGGAGLLVRTDAEGDIMWTRQVSAGTDIKEAAEGGYIITGGVAIVRTDENGETIWWRTLDGIANSVEQTPDGGYVVAGYTILSDSGTLEDLWIFRMGSENVTSINGDREVPQHVNLYQNYPNPFNPATVIGFELPVQSQVRLEVFNITGQRVARLLDTTMAEGFHEARFDASGLSSGIYFYRLNAMGSVFTRQMILIK